MLVREMGSTQRKMDLGRLALMPVFTFFLTLNSLAVYKDLKGVYPFNLNKAVEFTHHLLIVCFYILLVLLYFLRTSPISTSKSPVTNIIAIVTTFIPFTIPLLGRHLSVDPFSALISSVIIIFGMLLAIFALLVLGKNLSIIPQARKLVNTGPYRWVKHPLYLGELICVLGIVVGEITTPKIIIFILFSAAQIYRSLREEKLLISTFPEYQEYFLKTRRFVPGIF